MKRSMILEGKRALVTGGAVRIGRTITAALQSAGVEVVIHCRHSRSEAEALSDFVVCGDLRSSEQCARLVKEAGALDFLINNASVFSKESLAASSYESVLAEFQVNLFAPMELIRCFAAQGSRGAVVNLLDRRIYANDVSCVPYSLTKKGLAELTRLAALEYVPRIRVNGIAPGPVLPPPQHPAGDVRELGGMIPLVEPPSPEQIAEAVLFLLQADSITGQILCVDGGQHLLGNGV